MCSDDVDDQFTEKGRQLIRKEGEALAAGMRIGEILTAGDLELPGIVSRKKQGVCVGDYNAHEMCKAKQRVCMCVNQQCNLQDLHKDKDTTRGWSYDVCRVCISLICA